MDREQIIEYLEEVGRIADKEYYKTAQMKWYNIGYGVMSLLRKASKLSDEDLLQAAMYYEDVKPLDFND